MTKARDPLNLPTIAVDRREFIKGVGFAVLAVQCLPVTAFASGNPLRNANEVGDDLIIKSGPGAFHHVHYLLIPHAVLSAPPAHGVELMTTKALYHRHRIALTQNELLRVNKGETVTQKASSHVFVIALAKGTFQPAS